MEEAEVSIGLVEFKAPVGHPQGGALPALDRHMGNGIRRQPHIKAGGAQGVAVVSQGEEVTALGE